jgi:hypothetical protein
MTRRCSGLSQLSRIDDHWWDSQCARQLSRSYGTVSAIGPMLRTSGSSICSMSRYPMRRLTE